MPIINFVLSTHQYDKEEKIGLKDDVEAAQLLFQITAIYKYDASQKS